MSGPKKRVITHRISRDPRVGRMSLRARWLFACCIANADDEARMEGDVLLLRQACFPYDDGMTDQAVEDALAECTQDWNAGKPDEPPSLLIVAYTSGSERFLWLPGFERHQGLRYVAKSKLPAPPRDLVRKYFKKPHADEPKAKTPTPPPRPAAADTPKADPLAAHAEHVEQLVRAALAKMPKKQRAALEAAAIEKMGVDKKRAARMPMMVESTVHALMLERKMVDVPTVADWQKMHPTTTNGAHT